MLCGSLDERAGGVWRRVDTCVCVAEFLSCLSETITTLLIGYQFSPVAQSCPTLSVQSGQSLRCVRLFVTPWIAARQASLSITTPTQNKKLKIKSKNKSDKPKKRKEKLTLVMYEERILLERFNLTGLENQCEVWELNLENVQHRGLWTVRSRKDCHRLRVKMSPTCNGIAVAAWHNSL